MQDLKTKNQNKTAIVLLKIILSCPDTLDLRKLRLS